MTINHTFLYISRSQVSVLREFYQTSLRPLGYTELIRAVNETYLGYGSDYPYLWLKVLPDEEPRLPTHVALDALSQEAVDEFYKAALEAGGVDNGKPGIREGMGKQPYYAAFVKDQAGNNIEAVHVKK